MSSISAKIKHFRALKGFRDYRALAKACTDVSQEYLYKIEKGEMTNIGLEKLESIAKALGITVLDLLSDVDLKNQRPPNAIDAPKYTPYDIPVVGLAKAGRGGFFGDNGLPVNEWSRKIHRPEDVKDPHAYAVEIDGDSMEPLARKGDHFLCETDKKARNGDLVVVQTKTAERGLIPIHKELVPVFQKLLSRKKGDDFLFPANSESGHRIDCKKSLNDATKKLFEKHKIKAHVTPYQFRHTFATRLLNKTGDIRVVQQLMRHKSIQMTTRYATALDSRLRDAIDNF